MASLGNDAPAERFTREFEQALDDNLNTPNALAAVFECVSALNLGLGEGPKRWSPEEASRGVAILQHFDQVLDVLDRRVRSGLIPHARVTELAAGEVPTLEALRATQGSLGEDDVALGLALRARARSLRDFAQADAIRDEFRRRGVTLEDTPAGVRWKANESR